MGELVRLAVRTSQTPQTESEKLTWALWFHIQITGRAWSLPHGSENLHEMPPPLLSGQPTWHV